MLFFYRVYVKMVVSHVFCIQRKITRDVLRVLTIGTRKNIHDFDRTKEIFPRERFFITRRKTQQVRGNAYT